jgi:Xaa-Pro aminopeptidase
VPAARRFAAGDVVYSEVEARYAGYIAQIRRPLFIGAPSPEWAALHALAVEAYEQMCAPMRAGAALGAAVEALTGFVAAHGHRAVRAPMHARGLGEDLPHVSMQRLRPALLEQRLDAGQVFVVGPNVETPDGRRRLAWGDSVVVTDSGVRRLGKLCSDPLVAAG